jgi:hypothetical protein
MCIDRAISYGVEEKSGTWLSARAFITVMKTRVGGVDRQSITQMLVDRVDCHLCRLPSRHIRLVRNDDDEEAGVSQRRERARYTFGN